MCNVLINRCLAVVPLFLSLALLSIDAQALNIYSGEYYFDNSKLRFETVRLVVGNVNRDFTAVYNMEPVDGTQWWKVVIDSDVKDLTYFTFVETDMEEGVFEVKISVFLDILSNLNPNLRRTGLKSQTNIVDDPKAQHWVYCPYNNAAMSDGYWRPDYSYDATVSGSLPVVWLNTQDSVTISSKDHYINGTLWIEDDENPLGSSEQPLTIEVKGRGNWTWRNSFKKPYKVKFASQQSPLGLDRSRHFILMAHCEDISGYLRNTTGYEMSRLMGMPYSPSETPVELVLNGEYMGLYFLSEKIRVESGRVDIVEQSDMETIPDNVTGGWLLELSDDGNKVIQQHQGNDPANPEFCFVTQSPEVLSNEQRNYIRNLIARVDSCIFVPDKNDRGWEQLVDIVTLARFYIIHEVMENVEAFSGSLFMYKDLGWDEKLMFGPVWDFDNSYFQDNTTGDHFIFDYPSQFPFLWIKELLKFPRFQQQVRAEWAKFNRDQVLQGVVDHAWQWRELLPVAEAQDAMRWPMYASTHGPEKPVQYLEVLARKVQWLNQQWGNATTTGDVNGDGVVTASDVIDLLDYLLNSRDIPGYNYDISGDGVVTTHDLVVLYQCLLGL